jgi:hypothetical protein
MAQNNGAWVDYPDSTRQTTFFRATKRATKSVIVTSGQVLKAKSFLQSTAGTGKVVAHSGIAEKALVTFADILTTETLILGGLTFTAGGATCPKADIVAAFSGLTAGMTATQANAANPVDGGSFTSGTLGSWNVYKSSTADSVVFVSTTPNTNVTDIADTGTATNPTIAVTAGSAAKNEIAGVLLFDVDASGGDVVAEAYIQASFWADALVWSATPNDTITLFDGTTKACTDYHTGAFTNIIKQQFVEGSKFEELGFLTAGETLNV